MPDDLADARAQLAEVSAEVEALQERRTTLETELIEVDRQLDTLAVKVEPLVAQVRVLEAEPRARKQLEMLTQTLTAKLAKAPPTSPTVRDIRASLLHLSDETMLASSRLALVRRLLEDLGRYHVLDGNLWSGPPLAGRDR